MSRTNQQAKAKPASRPNIVGGVYRDGVLLVQTQEYIDLRKLGYSKEEADRMIAAKEAKV